MQARSCCCAASLGIHRCGSSTPGQPFWRRVPDLQAAREQALTNDLLQEARPDRPDAISRREAKDAVLESRVEANRCK
jgi:hypothetical protein